MTIDYGPAMIEHIILKADLDPTLKAATEFDSSLGRHNRRKQLRRIFQYDFGFVLRK